VIRRARTRSRPANYLSMNTWALLLGLAIFLIPTVVFAWSVFTRRGRENYARTVEKQQRWIEESEEWPKAMGIVPLKPPSSRMSKWAARHPWLATFAGATVFTVALPLPMGLALADSPEEAVPAVAIQGLEAVVILRLILGAFHKHYGKKDA
jgi:hypothetical protein